jgi:potassium-transporting ATPase KdpC subunit
MRELRSAILIFLVLTVLTGLVYPLVVTGIAHAVFPRQANGSLITEAGTVRGSSLIGQPFAGPRYFWGRPSATGPFPYNAANSSGSNLGPTNKALIDRVKSDVDRIRAAHPGKGPVPVDLVTTSGSGLDPHISPAAAIYQVERVAAVRGLAPTAVRQLVDHHIEGRWLGVIGEARVNVLELNLDLDRLSRIPGLEHPRPSPSLPQPPLSHRPPPDRERGGLKSSAFSLPFQTNFSLFSRLGGGRWEKRAGVMRGLGRGPSQVRG